MCKEKTLDQLLSSALVVLFKKISVNCIWHFHRQTAAYVFMSFLSDEQTKVDLNTAASWSTDSSWMSDKTIQPRNVPFAWIPVPWHCTSHLSLLSKYHTFIYKSYELEFQYSTIKMDSVISKKETYTRHLLQYAFFFCCVMPSRSPLKCCKRRWSSVSKQLTPTLQPLHHIGNVPRTVSVMQWWCHAVCPEVTKVTSLLRSINPAAPSHTDQDFHLTAVDLCLRTGCQGCSCLSF